MLPKPNYGMIQKIVKTDSDGVEHTIILEFNAKTLLYYKNFFNSDLMSDYINAVTNNGKNLEDKNLLKIKDQDDINNLDKEEYNNLVNSLMSNKFISFLEDFIAVLFYTAFDKEKLTIQEIKETYLPTFYVYDKDFIDAVANILDAKINKEIEKKTKILM